MNFGLKQRDIDNIKNWYEAVQKVKAHYHPSAVDTCSSLKDFQVHLEISRKAEGTVSKTLNSNTSRRRFC